MELLPGGTVRDRLTAGDLPGEVACGIALAACVGLDYAHGRGILHRDIKPENLLFGTADQLKVSDFGIARVLDGSETLATSGGLLLGSPAYMAPEQVVGGEPSPASDVYGVGMLLYKLLSRQLPFAEGGELVSVLYRRVHEQPRPLLEVAPNVPKALASATMRALATEPRDRTTSAEVFGAELADAAATAWGPGWLRRSGLTVMASGRIAARLSATSAGPEEGGARGGRTTLQLHAADRPSPLPSRDARGGGQSWTGPKPTPGDVVPLHDALAGGGPPAGTGQRPTGTGERPTPGRRVWPVLALGLAVCVVVAFLAVIQFLPGLTPRAVSQSPTPAAGAVSGPTARPLSQNATPPAGAAANPTARPVSQNPTPTAGASSHLQPTTIAFTSASALQDPARAFDSPGTPLTFRGRVTPNASGTVVLLDGNNRIAQVQVTDGQFSITIPAFTPMSLGSGTHLLTAQYEGNDVFAPSTSPVFTEVIQGSHS
jgi:serine/threonine-protein kinase